MRAATVFFFLLFVAPVAAEPNGSIFDVLDMDVFGGVLDTGGDYFDGCNRSWTKIDHYTRVGTVRYRVVPPTHISASIDIVGYNATSKIDGVSCICGCPADLAIIESRVSTSYAGFEANTDRVTQHITVVSAGGNTTATMRVSFLWHWTTHSSVTGTNRKHYQLETKTVSATKPHPKVISVADNNVFAQITEYNNTFDPYTLIQVDVPGSVTATSFKYKNNTAKHFNAIGVTADTHVDFIGSGVWKTTPDQDMILPYGDLCLIREAPINLSELQIQISTPYSTENVTKCNITTITSTPTGYVNFKVLFLYITIVTLLMLCVGMNLRRFR